MFKILYILFFILVILLLQYLLRKRETYNNHSTPSTTTTSSTTPTTPQPTDPCLDFNYIHHNYNSCCNAQDKEMGCRKPLCESAYEQYKIKLDEHTNLVNVQTDLQTQNTDLQTQNTNLQTQNTTLLNKKSRKNSLINYMEYPGVLSLGDITKSSNIPGSDEDGCLDNISIETAKSNCNDSSDCNSFFSYDPNSNAKVCFKSAYGQSGEITSGSVDNSFFVKVQ